MRGPKFACSQLEKLGEGVQSGDTLAELGSSNLATYQTSSPTTPFFEAVSLVLDLGPTWNPWRPWDPLLLGAGGHEASNWSLSKVGSLAFVASVGSGPFNLFCAPIFSIF